MTVTKDADSMTPTSPDNAPSTPLPSSNEPTSKSLVAPNSKEVETKHIGRTTNEDLFRVNPSQLAKDIVLSLHDEQIPWRCYAIVQQVLDKVRDRHDRRCGNSDCCFPSELEK